MTWHHPWFYWCMTTSLCLLLLFASNSCENRAHEVTPDDTMSSRYPPDLDSLTMGDPNQYETWNRVWNCDARGIKTHRMSASHSTTHCAITEMMTWMKP